MASHGRFIKFTKHSCYMVWQYQSTSIVIYILAIGLSSIYLYTLVNGWHCNYFSSVHTCTFIQRELIFTRLVFLTKKVKIIILRKTWVYILTCSLNSLVLHIVLHITSTESFWHYCYRRPTIHFSHKPRPPFVVTNSPQISHKYHALYS